MSKGLNTTLIVVGIVLLIGLGIFRWVIGEYNRVVAMDENVTASWAQVENQLKRRYDLIPNLIETVKGYAKHEKELFENIYGEAFVKAYDSQVRKLRKESNK